MNPTSILGVLFGSSLLIGAIALSVSGEQYFQVEAAWGIFINVPGLLIVLGGTIAATFISFPAKTLRRVLVSLLAVFRREAASSGSYIKEITRLAALARGGALVLEKEVRKVKNPFLRDGIQMLVDEFDAVEITEILRQRTDFRTRTELEEARVFRTLAKYAPAFGMVGTLIGLIGMLANMGSDDSMARIGGDLAVALVTTFYGLILANMFFLPFASKLENRCREESEIMRMIEESITMIAEKWHHRKVEDYLNSFVMPSQRVRTAIEEHTAPPKRRRLR